MGRKNLEPNMKEAWKMSNKISGKNLSYKEWKKTQEKPEWELETKGWN